MAGKNGGGIGGTAPAYKMDMSEMAARAACDYSRGVWRGEVGWTCLCRCWDLYLPQYMQTVRVIETRRLSSAVGLQKIMYASASSCP
jgi:hypothetical protein